MKKIFLLSIMKYAMLANAQNVGIGVPNPLNKLHVGGGFRLDTLTGVNGDGLLKHDANGVVYGIKFSGNINDVLRGDGTFGSGGAGSVGWLLNGNSGTNPLNNFLGTTDNQPLQFRLNNSWAGTWNQITNNYGIGIGALQSNTTGMQNVGFGHWALLSNTTGSSNTTIGNDALSRNTIGSSNTAVGNWALLLNTTGYQNTAIGDNALSRNNGVENTAIGYWTMLNNTSGNFNTAIGSGALFSNTTGIYNTAIGYQASLNNNKNFNTAIGSGALYANTGSNNTATGFESLRSNINGENNSAYGYQSLHQNTSGNENAAFGIIALQKNTDGDGNAAFGVSALRDNNQGNGNSAFGYVALAKNIGGEYNTAIGGYALANNRFGQSNVAIGVQALSTNVNGSSNTAIGNQADVTGDLTNATAIGSFAKVSNSNSMVFGDRRVSKWGFGRNVTNGVLQVGTDILTGNGAYLSSGGVWVNGSSISFKEDFSELDKKDILEIISSLKISRWRYKGVENEYHIGPIAEEFHKLFHVGTDEKYLSTIDPSGVALAGIQELYKNTREQQSIIEKQQKLIDELLKRVTALENK